MSADWETKPLGEVCEMIKRGIAPKYIESGGIRVVNQKCIRSHRINYNLARRNDPDKKRVPEERKIRVGDVLVNSTGTGTLGRVAQVREAPEEATTVDTHVTIVRPTANRFYDRFFGYMMIKIEDQLRAGGHGTSGQTELPRKELEKKFFVSFPTNKEEQKRIVAVLDKAFDGLDRARQNTEANLASAKELFEESTDKLVLESVSGAETTTMGELCRFDTGYAFKSNDAENSSSVQLVRIGNVYRNILDLSRKPVFYPEEFAIQHRKYLIGEGDIIVSLTGTAGKTDYGYAVRVPATSHQLLLNQRLARIMPRDERKLLVAYLFRFLRSPSFLRSLYQISRGTRQANISTKDMAKMHLAVPPIEKQKAVVSKIEALERSTDSVMVGFKKRNFELSELRQSLLQRAFAGELTR